MVFSTQPEFKNYTGVYSSLVMKKRLFDYPMAMMSERFTMTGSDIPASGYLNHNSTGGIFDPSIVGQGYNSRGYSCIDITPKMLPLQGKTYLAVSFWLNVSSAQTSSWERIIWLNQDQLTANKAIVDMYYNNDRIEVYSYEQGGSFTKRVFSNNIIPRDEWFHVFLEIDYNDGQNGRLNFYINGSRQSLNQWTNSSRTDFPYDVTKAFLLSYDEGFLRSPVNAIMCDFHMSTDKRVLYLRPYSSYDGFLPSIEV